MDATVRADGMHWTWRHLYLWCAMPSQAVERRRAIHVIEAFDHFELIHGWIAMLQSLSVPVTVHLSPWYRMQMAERYASYTQISFSGPTSREAWPRYVRELEDSPASIWIVSTVGRRPTWFYPLKRFSYLYLVLHDLNYYFGIRISPPGHFPILSHLRNVTLPFRRKNISSLLSAAEGFIYPTTALQHYGRKHSGYPNKFHVSLPFAAPDKERQDTVSNTGCFRVVVPGAVRTTTRDYHMLARGLSILAARQPGRYEIHFAGKVVDTSVRRGFTQVVKQNSGDGTTTSALSVHFYPEGLDFEAYRQLLSSAQVLVCPLKPYAKIGGTWEAVGLSKISGSFFDAVRFGKPIYLPAWYDPSANIPYRYSSAEDLGELLCQAVRQRHIPHVTYAGFDTEQGLTKWRQLLTGQPPADTVGE